ISYYSVDVFFSSSRRRHTSWPRDWSSDVCSSDLNLASGSAGRETHQIAPEFFAALSADIVPLSTKQSLRIVSLRLNAELSRESQIGRASCRERVWISVGRVSLSKELSNDRGDP